MKLEGSTLLPAARDEVWKLLTDPARLAKCLPGCERLEPDGPDRYKMIVKFGIAAISGEYSGTIELTEKNPPASLRMRVDSKGTAGFMTGEGRLELREKSGQTELRYSGEAQVGGLIASVGQRMIESAAKKILQQFFDSAAAQLKSSSSKA